MNLFRRLCNALYKSGFRFDDGSILYHHPLDNVIHNYSGTSPRKIVDIPLLHDQKSGLERIDTSVSWRWRENFGDDDMERSQDQLLSKEDSQDLCKKLEFFVAKSPKWFEPFTCSEKTMA